MDDVAIILYVAVAVFCFIFAYMVMNWFDNNRKF